MYLHWWIHLEEISSIRGRQWHSFWDIHRNLNCLLDNDVLCFRRRNNKICADFYIIICQKRHYLISINCWIIYWIIICMSLSFGTGSKYSKHFMYWWDQGWFVTDWWTDEATDSRLWINWMKLIYYCFLIW